jgi:hypothetical protein
MALLRCLDKDLDSACAMSGDVVISPPESASCCEDCVLGPPPPLPALLTLAGGGARRSFEEAGRVGAAASGRAFRERATITP